MVGLLALAEGANAACVSPAGNVGDVRYASNYGVMAFCNGTGWVSMAGGVSVTVNTGGGGATPAGSSADVQFNSAGALAADTGNFTYASGLLTAPNISTTAITASGLGTFGSALVNGGMTVTGQASITTISTTVLNVAPSISSVIALNGGSGNMISSGSAVVSTSSGGSIGFYTGGSQAMKIKSNGDVELGGSLLSMSPTVTGVQYQGIGLQSSYAGGTGVAFIDARRTNGIPDANIFFPHFADNSSVITFGTTAAGDGTDRRIERMRIDSAGNLLLHGGQLLMTVSSWTATPNPGITMSSAAGQVNIGNSGQASGFQFMNFSRSGVAIGSITQNGTTGVAYNTTSDRRVKENITDTREGLQKLMRIGVKDFSFKSDASHTIVNGFIAQDLQKVYPEAVTTNGDNGQTPLKDKSKPWSVDYGRVTPLIIKAVQELKVANDTTASRTEILEMQLKAANDNIREMKAEIERLKRTAR